MKYSRIILPTILISSSLLVLFNIKSQKSQSSGSTDQKSSLLNQQDKTNSNIFYQKLSVLSNRCRGCGKCVRLDPDHFEISNRIAVVTSSNNLDSSNLVIAINNCPAQAIILE